MTAPLIKKATPTFREKGAGWEALLVYGARDVGAELEGGRILVRCHHQHRDLHQAIQCTYRLWRRRCPRAWAVYKRKQDLRRR